MLDVRFLARCGILNPASAHRIENSDGELISYLARDNRIGVNIIG